MKRLVKKIHVKKGDQVVVISGNSKGEKGKVTEVIPGTYRAIVEDVNMVKKHRKPTGENPGGISDMPAPIHISNLMVIDPKSGDATRIGRKKDDKGKLQRYSKKTGEIIS